MDSTLRVVAPYPWRVPDLSPIAERAAAPETLPQITAGDLALPEGVKLVQEAEDLVINVTEEEVAVDEDAEAAEAEAEKTDNAEESSSEE